MHFCQLYSCYFFTSWKYSQTIKLTFSFTLFWSWFTFSFSLFFPMIHSVVAWMSSKEGWTSWSNVATSWGDSSHSCKIFLAPIFHNFSCVLLSDRNSTFDFLIFLPFVVVWKNFVIRNKFSSTHTTKITQMAEIAYIFSLCTLVLPEKSRVLSLTSEMRKKVKQFH